MKIGFDAKRYFHNTTGLGNYSRDLIEGLCTHFPDNKYFLFDHKPELDLIPKNAVAVAPAGQSLLWREHGMIKDMKLYQLDIFHGLSNELPYGKFSKSIKKIVTVHDVIFRLFPEHYTFVDSAIYNEKTRHAVKSADTIIATSRATANDLIKFYKADEQKIEVVYQTCGNLHRINYSDDIINAFRAKHHLQQPYILYVSSFQKRKNHLPLIRAFAALKNNTMKLVLAGRKGETYNECITLIKNMGLENKVNLVDDISQADLPYLYRSANAFIYPSMIEGFGIPLIEAACAGLPMAVNDIPVFREIAPKGTYFFEADEEDSVVRALEHLVRMDKGNIDYRAHLKLFDNEIISQLLIEIYSK